MFTDIVGYTRKMGEDEDRMLGLLQVHSKMIEATVANYDGDIIKRTGDGFIISFESAIAAVRCALEIQQAHLEYNKDKPETEQIVIRIGVHLGDIVIKGGDVFGDGVNVASRVEPLAQPGGICITRAVYDIVKKKMEIKAVELGPQNLKNVAEAIEVFHLLTDTIGEKEVRKAHKAKQSKRRRWIVPVVGFGVIAVVLIAFIMGRQGTFESEGVDEILQPEHTQVTFVGDASFPTISPDGKSFAYYHDQKVSVQDMSGGEPVDVFEIPECFSLRWSPDGSELLVSGYVKYSEGAAFIVSRLGGTSRKITLLGPHISWSPDGRKIACAIHRSKKIAIVDKATGEIDTLTVSGDYTRIKDIDWSPTGNFILFLTVKENISAIWTITLDGKFENRILDGGIISPRWAPSGDAIYYLRYRGQTRDLMKIKVDPKTGQSIGNSIEIMTGLQSGYLFSLSEDGDQLLYTRRAYYSNLFSVILKPETDGKRLQTKQLTKGTHLLKRPSISPDGELIAFTIVKMGTNTNIYTMPMRGGDIKQVTFLEAFCFNAVWSPDGEELAFSLVKEEGGQVWKVNLKTGKIHHFKKTNIASPWWLSWAPSPNIVYNKPGNYKLFVLDPEDGNEKELIRDEDVGHIIHPVYSPDLKKLAVAWNHPEMTGLWVIPVKDSVRLEKAIPLIEGSVFPFGWSKDSKWIYTFDEGKDTEGKQVLTVSAEDGTVRDSFKLPFKHVSKPSSVDGEVFACTVTESQSDVWVVKNFDPDVK